MSLWKKLDGIKTKIGAALLLIAQAGPMIYPLPEVWALVNQVGVILAGAGLVHTGVKKMGEK